jgi:hypothetical protein
MNVVPYLVALSVLAVVVIVLLVYRRQLTSWEDDTIHVHDGEDSRVAEQEALVKKLNQVDRIGKVVTALLVIGALVLAVVYTYVNQIADQGVKMS